MEVSHWSRLLISKHPSKNSVIDATVDTAMADRSDRSNHGGNPPGHGGIVDADVSLAPDDRSFYQPGTFQEGEGYEHPFHGQDNYSVGYDGQPSSYMESPSIYSSQQYGPSGDLGSIPEFLLLNHYCASAFPPRDSSEEAKEEADLSWEPVRDWLRTHTAEEVREAAQQRGNSSMTALHAASRNAPPLDIIEVLLSIAGDTAQWPDAFGWLPIHYACACGAGPGVIKSLADTYPESKTTVDRRGRTPLHFALGNSNPDSPVSPAVVVLLSSSGAAKIADDNGMLPLHYACAYGASEEALHILTDAYSDAVTTMDRLERTPLHFALSNAGRKAAPAAVRLLLTLHPEILNNTGIGPLPLKVLAEYAIATRNATLVQRESVIRCLEHLLSFNPDPTPDFFTALQSLPDWLKERAVITESVQRLLNIKIAQRFPTGILILDFFVQMLVIVSYAHAAVQAVDRRFNADDNENYRQAVDHKYMIPLYIGVAYFALRALIQVVSLLALGAFRVWLMNPSNWLEMVYIIVLCTWCVMLRADPGPVNGNDASSVSDSDDNLVRVCLAFFTAVIWMKFLAYLRNTYIDFAVFLGGLFYVVRRLVAFLISLFIILIAFSQMWYTLYRRDLCQCPTSCDDLLDPTNKCDLECLDTDTTTCNKGVYCNRWTAFLNAFTMLLGEVDADPFIGRKLPMALFVLFMFLAVVLLANVLIAIVTDSYKVIQDQRAAIVFWSNRLVFIAEMDAVANGPWRSRLNKRLFGVPEREKSIRSEVTFGRETWKKFMDLFEDDIDEGAFSLEFLCYTTLRFFVLFFVIPLWILFGIASLGSLWPPQVRESVFTSKVNKHSSEVERDNELRKKQVRVLQEEVQTLKDDLIQELAIDRTQIFQMRSSVAEKKQEIQNEMKHIKRIVAMLFEQVSGS